MTDPAARRPARYNREPLAHVGQIIAIASGKGGVGKSSCAVCLAHALQASGRRAGLLDADIHGPSIPRMLGIADAGQPEVKDQQLIPITGYGIRILSMGHLAGDGAAIWRGPMVTKALTQMLRHARWGSQAEPLDALLIDMPPGTGDIALTLAQTVPLDGAIIVTTPQEIATADAHKAAVMFEKVNVPLKGIIENMSYFVAPDGSRHTLFGEGGGAALAGRLNSRLLARLPLDPALGAALDKGEKPDISADFAEIASLLAK